ncbi:uncharacterized protein N0V89_004594 [Didymosphaeria variabile]|uniref:Uncharacterized protein n=1 Tax=Didymosphaeria variabile TaxID=1932322 RepID=A0A9W9CDD2_9PLEO|nr:uncharacterized protein N0V89_004594 [Didymosphaeria variabile]KAJ4356560.1 hypothetical protein N0V89_004594 [Didymosphaeria variabile]
MSSQSQPPDPKTTTSQPKQARSRKAAVPAEQNVSGRAGSAGGVMLEKDRTAKGTAPSKPAAKAAAVATSEVEDKDAAITSTGPNRQRRRPRKLNRDTPANDAPSAATGAPITPAPTTEIEALKSRVRGLEAKVEELYQSSEGRTRSPRRRGKGRKNSSAQSVPTVNTVSAEVEEEEADEELIRAEEELESARQELEIYQPRNRMRGKRSTSGDIDYIEEIPREGAEEMIDNEGRQVTLTGSYRIPLPAKLDMKDVKTIQSGVSAAQNVARSFLEQRRAARGASASSNPPTPSAASAKSTNTTPKPSRKTSSMEVTKETDGKSWGEWFGGYSVAISRAVKTIEAEAAVETQRAQASAPAAAPGSRKASGKRPTARGRQSEGVA